MITTEQWERVEEKYKKLMYAISYRIGGDRLTNDIDDSYQEVSMSAMDAISTYSRKLDKPFEEFFDTKEFDKYIKTCMWNRKNANGNKIKKRGRLNNPISIHEYEEIWYQEGTEGIAKSNTSGVVERIVSATSGMDASSIFFEADLSEESSKVIDLLLDDGKIIKPNGKINVNRLARELDKTKNEVKYTLKRLEKELGGYNA